jgi:hypothetical protein
VLLGKLLLALLQVAQLALGGDQLRLRGVHLLARDIALLQQGLQAFVVAARLLQAGLGASRRALASSTRSCGCFTSRSRRRFSCALLRAFSAFLRAVWVRVG